MYSGENNPMYGKTLSDKQKQIISDANKGKIVSEETREKIRQANIGRINSNERNIKSGLGIKQAHVNGRYNYKAMAESRKGFHQPESQKQKVAETLADEYDFNDPNGNHIHVVNLRKFCKENNLDQGNMHRVHNELAKQHKGWTKYI